MNVNPGLRLFFNRLVWITRLAGSRLLAGDQVDQRGFEGAVNLVFAPSDDGTWHCLLSETGFRFARGPHENPIGTVRVDQDVFLQILAGLTSYYTAEMTGKIRVEGDGHSAWILSSTLLQTRSQAQRKGLMGWLARRMIRSTLKKSQTGYELQLS